jgi:hypothetical protein
MKTASHNSGRLLVLTYFFIGAACQCIVYAQCPGGATCWTGSFDDNWHDDQNWTNGVPTDQTDAIHDSGNHVIEITGANAEAKSFTFGNSMGSTRGLRIFGGNINLTVTGNMTNSGGAIGEKYTLYLEDGADLFCDGIITNLSVTTDAATSSQQSLIGDSSDIDLSPDNIFYGVWDIGAGINTSDRNIVYVDGKIEAGNWTVRSYSEVNAGRFGRGMQACGLECLGEESPELTSRFVVEENAKVESRTESTDLDDWIIEGVVEFARVQGIGCGASESCLPCEGCPSELGFHITGSGKIVVPGDDPMTPGEGQMGEILFLEVSSDASPWAVDVLTYLQLVQTLRLLDGASMRAAYIQGAAPDAPTRRREITFADGALLELSGAAKLDPAGTSHDLEILSIESTGSPNVFRMGYSLTSGGIPGGQHAEACDGFSLGDLSRIGGDVTMTPLQLEVAGSVVIKSQIREHDSETGDLETFVPDGWDVREVDLILNVPAPIQKEGVADTLVDQTLEVDHPDVGAIVMNDTDLPQTSCGALRTKQVWNLLHIVGDDNDTEAVKLKDSYDNSIVGNGTTEAIYVKTFTRDEGTSGRPITTNGLNIYYFDSGDSPGIQAYNTCYGDPDGDGDTDITDFAEFQLCFTGPGGGPLVGLCCALDLDVDDDVDLTDFSEFMLAFGVDPRSECTPPSNRNEHLTNANYDPVSSGTIDDIADWVDTELSSGEKSDLCGIICDLIDHHNTEGNSEYKTDLQALETAFGC